MGFFDDVVSAFAKPEVLGAGLLGATGLITGLNNSNYSTTEEAYNQSLALQYAQLNQQAQISRDQIAAQLQAAGIAADKAVKAATIQVEGMLKTAKINAASNAMALHEKALADSIAQRIQAKRGNPEVLTKAQEDVNTARLTTGQIAQQGFGNAANVLAAFRK